MHWLSNLLSRRRIYSDLHEEIELHIAEHVDALVSQGMSRRDAESAARRAFGNVTRVEERGREQWLWPRTERFLADLKFAFRKLRNSPGFALTAVLTLAFGIGANVVVFSIVNSLLWRPLPVPRPENLYQIIRGENDNSQSYPDYKDFRDRDPSFSEIAAYKMVSSGLVVGNTTLQNWGWAVSGNYFDMLGAQPAAGRFFHTQDEHGLGSAPYIVLSDDLWHRQFGARRDAVGEKIEINRHVFTVLGVAPPSFHGHSAFIIPDFFIPLVNAEQITGWSDLCCRDHLGLEVLGRLKAGVNPAQATESLNALARQMAREDPKDDGLRLALRKPGTLGYTPAPVKAVLAGIMVLAGLVLLAACANLAGIFAARTSDRGGELALRMAIGATRGAVLRQLLTEAVMVALAGGAVGSAMAWALLAWLSRWRAFVDLPVRFPVDPDLRLFAIAIVISIASGLLFGLLPARQLWRTDVVRTIKTGSIASERFRRFALRDLLLVVQIVVCALLVTASLVAVRSMQKALRMQMGYNPAGVTLAQTDLRMAGYTGATALPAQRRLLDAARAIPGVSAATVSDAIPFNGSGVWFVYKPDTTVFQPSHMAFSAFAYLTTPGYFNTAGTHLLTGRDFTWQDQDGAPMVAIVNRTFARRLFGDAPAIGRRFALWATAKYQVIGVVEDGEYSMAGEDPQPAMFLPLAQGVGGEKSSNTVVMVRSTLPQGEMAAALCKALNRVEPGAPFNVRPWNDLVDRSMMPWRVPAVMIGVMGLLAAMLAVTGIFGMASYTVSKRMREQGIRVALGAQRSQVVRAMLRRPAILLLIGSGTGVIVGLLATRAIAHLISLVMPRDPVVLAGVVVTMTLLGLFASWIPARRALRIDPARLLRE